MKLQIFIILLGVCLLGTHSDAAEKPAAGKGADQLIALLADENFKVREEAALDLWKLGVEALPALKSAANDADPEKSTRARDIVRRIELGITPETEPAVIELTDRFVTATLEEKAVILSQLKKRRAWRQMLKIYAMESSDDVRAELEASIDDVALTAAREAIVAGDAKSAREYLELGAVDETGLLGHADFLRSQGLLDQELKNVAAGEAKSDAWKFALMRAAGNTQAAADIARKLGNLKSAALMSGIEGDPLPWLEQMQKSSDENRLTAAYAEAAARAWKGEISGDAGLEVFTKALDSKSGSERDNALNALHALGRFKLAEPAMVKAHPLIAFQYFDAIEKSGDAMRAIGLKEDASDAGPWIEALLTELEGVDVEDQREPSTAMERLAALAYFNERRGLHARNDALFLEPIALLAEKNPELFNRLVGNFFGRGEVPYQAPKLAWRMALKWAGQDQQRWQALAQTVLGEDDVITGWWAWLGELDPESDISARFDAMLVIFKIRNDPENIRDKFIERVWKSIDDAPEGVRPRLLASMLTMGITAYDLANSLRAMDRMPEKTRAAIPWESRLVWLSAANRWDEAASLILAQIKDTSNPDREPSPEIHAYAASSLRRADRAKEAEKHDRLADQLALGQPSECLRVANGYAFGGEYRTAGEWWKRALTYADPNDDQEDFAMFVRSYADDLLERSDWPKAAAAFEMINSIVIAAEPRWQSPIQFSRMRLHADMSRAFGKLKADRKGSIELLERCHRNAISDGSLADYFLPALRKAGLKTEHDQWFRASWDYLRGEIAKFPDDDHLRNTAAWFASRSMRELEAAEKDITLALSYHPDEAAYLDTMAEIQFAKGNRAKAVEWSNRAMKLAPADDQIRRQSARFRSDPFPLK
ncbi:MAG: hypothetical protein ACK49N_07905 [Verrucomicrobiota bacterium]